MVESIGRRGYIRRALLRRTTVARPDQLGISENTINFHVKNIVGKLHANDRTHAVTIATRRELRPN
jgi:hypothetical protein